MQITEENINTCIVRVNRLNCIIFGLKRFWLFHRNIEDILAEKGESVKKLSESDSLEFLVQDLKDKIEKEKQTEEGDKS